MTTLYGHSNYVTCILKWPRSQIVISGSADQTLKVWCTTTNKCLRTLFGHTSSITNLLLLSSSSLPSPYDELVSCSCDGEIRVWSVSLGLCLTSVQGRVRNISNLLFSWHTTNEMVGTSCSLNESLIKVWSLSSKTNKQTCTNAPMSNDSCVKTFTGHTREVKCLTYLNELSV